MIAASQTNDSGRRTVPSQQQVQRIKTLLKWALTLVSLGFVAQFIVTNASEFSHLIPEWQKRGDQGWTLFALIACYLLSWVLVAAQFHFPLQRLCASIRLSENVALVIAGALLNYSPFKAGMLYRFYYFKKWHDLSYSALAGLQLLRILLTFAASGFLGIIVFSISLAHIAQVKQANFVLFFVFALMLFGSVLIVFFAGKFAGRVPKPLSGLAGELVRGLNELQNSAVLTLILFALIACQFAVLGVQYGIIFHVLGVYPPVLAYFVLIPLITILGMLSITPGNLGLREIAVAAALSFSTVDFRSGMFVGLMDRGAITVATILFGLLALAYLAWTRRTTIGHRD